MTLSVRRRVRQSGHSERLQAAERNPIAEGTDGRGNNYRSTIRFREWEESGQSRTEKKSEEGYSNLLIWRDIEKATLYWVPVFCVEYYLRRCCWITGGFGAGNSWSRCDAGRNFLRCQRKKCENCRIL